MDADTEVIKKLPLISNKKCHCCQSALVEKSFAVSLSNSKIKQQVTNCVLLFCQKCNLAYANREISLRITIEKGMQPDYVRLGEGHKDPERVRAISYNIPVKTANTTLDTTPYAKSANNYDDSIDKTLMLPNNNAKKFIETKNRPWDMEEEVLLFDLFLRNMKEKNDTTKNANIYELSKVLKRRASILGIPVTETFRNTTGIEMKLGNIEYVCTNGRKGLSSFSTIDKEVYSLYYKNPLEYKRILGEAKQKFNTQEISITETVVTSTFDEKPGVYEIKWNENITYENTAPISLTMYGFEDKILTWSRLFVTALNKMIFRNQNVDYLKFSCLATKKLFSNNSGDLKTPLRLYNGDFVESDFSADDMVNIIKALLGYFSVSFDKIKIKYNRKGQQTSVFKNNNIEKIQAKQNTDDRTKVYLVDWDNLPNLTNTYPLKFEFNGFKKYPTSWVRFLVCVCDELLSYKPSIDLLIFVPSKSTRVFVASTPEGMYRPKILQNGYYIDVNHCSSTIIQLVKELFIYADVPIDLLKVDYTSNEMDSSSVKSIQAKSEKYNEPDVKENFEINWNGNSDADAQGNPSQLGTLIKQASDQSNNDLRSHDKDKSTEDLSKTVGKINDIDIPIDKEMSTAKNKTSSDLIKEAFSEWLSEGRAKHYPPELYISCIDDVSSYLIQRKITFIGLWHCTSFEQFRSIYDKAITDRVFKANDKKTHALFVQVGQAYLKFLKSEPTLLKASNQNLEIEPNENERLTIKESIVTVKAALIEFSNHYKGEIKTRKEIVEELSTKYGHNEHSILPADYEVGLNNSLPKLFRRIDYGTYECLGFNSVQESSSDVRTHSFARETDKEKMIKIIMTRFKNGFRKSSSIDFERFKNYYTEEYGEGIKYDSGWFNYFLSEEALVYDDRAYIYDAEVIGAVHAYLDQMGSPCIFIDAFYNKYSSELYTFSIFSIEMLRAFIEKNYHDITVKWDYILMQENVLPSDLVKDVFCERETWAIDDLQERLPCLKIDTIRQVMNSAEYFRVDKGTYTHIDNMDLPDSEGEKIQAFVENKLLERDYVTANELDLSKFEELNPHCSFAAVRDALFYKFLSKRYDKSGQVITRAGGKLRVLDIMEQYCRKADSVTFEELNTFEATFDPEGRTHSQCLIAGHNTMVRVSSELFVSDSNVDFDVARIDEAIALYCPDIFIPIRGVTDFSLFPYAGYPWNLFLLESYLRRFSRVFKYDVRAVNSTNIGAIVRKSFYYNEYDEILALVLAKSSIRLSDREAVGNYLFENGYIGWRNLGKSEEKIIKNARKLREGGTV